MHRPRVEDTSLSRLAPPALLLDDGELESLHDLLEELVEDVVHLSGRKICSRVTLPRQLLITTARRALTMPEFLEPEEGPVRPVWIAIHDQDLLPLRAQLRDVGVDFTVHASVDPETLRLLLIHVLHNGPERRSGVRLPVGRWVSCRLQDRYESAVLAEISAKGCRLKAGSPAPSGTPIVVKLPPDVESGRRLELQGRVVRSTRHAEHEPLLPFALAVEFEEMGLPAERQLRAILEGNVIANPGSRLAVGVEGSEPVGEDAEVEPHHEAAPAGSPAHDRRRRRRAAYSRTVHAFSGEVARVMLGRDLSSAGMRVESREDLSVGWRLRIALQRGAGEWPLVVHAAVARDDGELGLGLRFEDVDPSLKRELERLVTNLPDIEPLGNNGEDTVRIVVSTILDDEGPGG